MHFQNLVALQLVSKLNPFTNKAHKYNEIKHEWYEIDT